jgi:membrane protein required for colicin V production
MTPPALPWVDWALLAVLVLSVLVGLWRGVVFEMLSLAGWVAAYLAAQAGAPWLATQLPVGRPGGAVNHAVAFAAAFLLALLVWSLAARLLRLAIHATPLQAIDRVLGAVFGLLRGVLLLLAAATVVMLTPAAQSGAWQQSRGAAWLAVLLQGLKPMLPASFARHLPTEV